MLSYRSLIRCTAVAKAVVRKVALAMVREMALAVPQFSMSR